MLRIIPFVVMLGSLMAIAFESGPLDAQVPPLGQIWGVQPSTGQIVLVDPLTGATVPAFPTPDAINPSQIFHALSVAEGGTSLIYMNPEGIPTDLYRLDPNSGAVLSIAFQPLTTAASLSYQTNGPSGPAIYTIDNGTGVFRMDGFGAAPVLHNPTSPNFPGAQGGDDQGREFCAVVDPMSGGPEILEYDLISGADIALLPGLPDLAGLAFDGVQLYATNYITGEIFIIDPDTGTVLNVATVVGGPLTALAAGVPLGVGFRRGDADGDGFVHVVLDGGFLAQVLLGTSALQCQDAGDVNDDGLLDLADITFLMSLALVSGPGVPPPPYPDCGPDPTPDALGCGSYSSCVATPTPLPVDPNLQLSFSPPTGPPGGQVSVEVILVNNSGSFGGWSFGVCHDPALAAVLAVDLGPTTLGLAPDFEVRDITPGAGWAVAALLSFTGDTTLDPGPQSILYIAHYDHFGVAEPILDFCDAITPFSGGTLLLDQTTIAPVIPTQQSGTLGPAGTGLPFIRGDVDGTGEVNFLIDAAFLSEALVGAGPAPACFDAGDVNDDGSMDLTDVLALMTIGFEGGSGLVPIPYPGCGLDPTFDTLPCDSYTSCSVTPPPPPPLDTTISIGFSGAEGSSEGIVVVDLLLDNTGGDLNGWSFAVCHDDTMAALVAVDPGGTLVELDADFSSITLVPGEGWTAGVLLSVTASVVLGPGSGYQLYTAQYDLFGLGGSELTVCEGIGFPPVPIAFVGSGGGGPVTPITVPGTTDPVPGQLVRGDANTDGFIDVSDAIWIISWSFVNGPEPLCYVTADANDDGFLNIADAVWLINFLFQMGPQPPHPYPSCGLDPTPDSLTCVAYPLCF